MKKDMVLLFLVVSFLLLTATVVINNKLTHGYSQQTYFLE